VGASVQVVLYKKQAGHAEWHHIFFCFVLKLIICQTVQTEAREVAAIPIKVSPNTGHQKDLQKNPTQNVPMLNTATAMAAKAIPVVLPARDAKAPPEAVLKNSDSALQKI
jgi:hypothetical protein